MSFINPVKDSEIKKPLLSNTVKIESNKNDDVLCPYNGVIVQYNPDECNGKLTIQHEVNDEIIYSIFCNLIEVPKNLQYPKTKVSKGTKIGEIYGDTIQYSITDQNGNSLNVFDYIKKEIKCKSNQVLNDKTNKCEDKKTTDSTETNNKSQYNDIKADPITSILLKGMMSPFQVASDMFDSKKKKEEREKREKEKEEEEKKKEDEKLNEEIKRIKELLK